MNSYFRYIFLHFGFLALAACSTQKVKFSTNVPAQLKVANSFVNEGKELGQVPAEFESEKVFDQKDFAFLSFTADGYEPFRMIVPSNYSGGEIKVKLIEKEKYTPADLKEQVEKEVETEYQKRYTSMIRSIFEVQTALGKKDLKRASGLLAEISNLKAPESVIRILEGNYNLINGQPQRALASFERALELDPSNSQVKTAVEQIKSQLGGRR